MPKKTRAKLEIAALSRQLLLSLSSNAAIRSANSAEADSRLSREVAGGSRYSALKSMRSYTLAELTYLRLLSTFNFVLRVHLSENDSNGLYLKSSCREKAALAPLLVS